MAIKISNNTIIDDSRNIVDAGIATAKFFDGFVPGGDKVFSDNTTVNNGKINVALESDIVVGSGKTLTVSTGSTIILNPFDFEKSSVEELLIDKKLTVGFTSSFDVVTSGVGSVGVTSTRLVGFGTVLPPNIEVGLLVKPIPGIIGAGTTVVSFVAAGSSTGVSTITISPASLNTTVQENITFKFGSYGEKESSIILDGETGVIKSGSNSVIIDGENSKVTVGDIDLDGSAGSLSVTANGSLSVTANGTERARIDSSGRLLMGTSTARANGDGSTDAKLQLNTSGWYAADIAQYAADDIPVVLYLQKSRGASIGAQSVVSSNDGLGAIRFAGSDGTGFKNAAQISCSVDGTPGANDMPARLVFSTTADGASSPTEALRITSDKYLRMAASTGGIQFNGDTAAANALDDYEEGTWTPVISDGTNNATMSGANQGRYIKIGNTVTCNCLVSTSSLGSVSGNIRVTGLPFTNGNYYATAASGWGNGLAITTGESLGAWVALNATYLNITKWSLPGGTNNATATDWSADGEAMFSFSYTV